MSPATACPSCDQLRALIEGRTSAPEQAALTGHLDNCSCCQQALDALAAGDPALIESVCAAAREQPASESAFWPALDQLQQQVTRSFGADTDVKDAPPPEVKLDFLKPAEAEGRVGMLNHFEVVKVIGRGGMGVVLHGFDPCLERDVALKVLAPELADNELARKRFCREARTAARLSHDNLVAVHYVDEIEETELPFLVMQYVPGESLEQRLDRVGKLSTPEVVRVGAQAAAGLAAAHRIGLIHRDIKPGNILLEEGTDKVKLTDFGLARAAEDVKLTSAGFVAGTPLYMSPEQARGEEADQRSDLFSFGTVLYEMLAGKPPFEGKTPLAVLRHIADDPHPPIKSLNPETPDWLAAVVDKLLAKKPEDRFQTAAQVAEILAGQYACLAPEAAAKSPCSQQKMYIGTAPRTRLGRALRWAIPLALGVLIGAVAWALIAGKRSAGPVAEPPSPPPLMTLAGNSGAVWDASFAPDGGRLAMAIDDGRVLVWDLAGQRVATTLTGHTSIVWSVNYSADGARIVTSSDDGTVKVWDAAGGKPLRSLPHTGSARGAAFSPDGKRVVSGDRTGKARIWDLETGNELRTLDQDGGVLTVAFAPDGQTVASGGSNKVVKLWDADTGRLRLTLSGHAGPVYGVAVSPDSRLVASASRDGTVKVWDAGSGTPVWTLQGHGQDVWSVSFSKDGKTLASAGQDGVRLWDVETGKEVGAFRGHRGTVHAVSFDRDGGKVASGGRDGTVKVWDASRR